MGLRGLQAGTDVVVEETVRSVGTLASGKTEKEEITLALENGRRYDIRVTVWQDGRMRESGSMNVFLPDRTVAERRLACSLLSVSATDVMTPDIDAGDTVTGLVNGGSSSGNLVMEFRVVYFRMGITAVRESRPLGMVPADSGVEKKVSVTVLDSARSTSSVALPIPTASRTVPEGTHERIVVMQIGRRPFSAVQAHRRLFPCPPEAHRSKAAKKSVGEVTSSS